MGTTQNPNKDRPFLTTAPDFAGSERASAHATAYCSPGAASSGTAILTTAVSFSPPAMSTVPGVMVVHLESSFAVSPSPPTKTPSSMAAADEYRATWRLEVVEFETSTRRSMTVPGARWSTM
jgi:hypothetical protein